MLCIYALGMEHRKYKLRDIATVEISGVDKKIKDGEASVKLCNFVDVYYNWAITSEMGNNFMEATARPNEIERFKLKKGQVAITKDSETRFDIGIATYIADDFDNVILGYHNALITPNPEKLNGKYLNALLHTDYARKYFANNASGSGQRYALSVDALNDFPVPLIPLEEQIRIGNIFSSIDQKIALNRAINDNLEAMAKQLYDYWFVQFDFPNEEGKPYKSSGGKMVWNEKLKREIPEGWVVEKVSALIEPIERGISYASADLLDDSAMPMINLACFSKNGDYRAGEMKYYSGIIPGNKYVQPMDMLIACTDMTQGADIIGRPILASHEFEQYTFSTDLATLRPKSIAKMYLYYTLRTPFYHKYIRPFASGTNVKHLNIAGVENYIITVPTDSVQLKFERTIVPVKEKQSKTLNEIALLIKQRDELLPLLMNGQVSVNYHLSHD